MDKEINNPNSKQTVSENLKDAVANLCHGQEQPRDLYMMFKGMDDHLLSLCHGKGSLEIYT